MNIKENFKNNWHIYILAVVIFAAAFLRSYKFNDWLVFKSDQARDLTYAQEVMSNGPDKLRLMGPKIEVVHIEGDKNKRGDSLHLGPAYYYVQTAFAFLLGGSEPWKLAFPDFLFSVLAIPLFYYFLRQNFSKGISLLTTILFAFGFFLTECGRFAWNPNGLVFWEILFALSLFKTASNVEQKSSGIWMVAVALSFGVASQFHTIALFAFPAIAAVFWLLHKPKAGLKSWFAAILTLFIIYAPVFTYEYKNNYDNTKRLIASLQRERDEESSVVKSIREDFQRHGEFATLTLTTFHNREIQGVETMGGFFYLVSIISIFIVCANSRFRIVQKIKEKSRPNIFLELNLIWGAVIFLLFIKLAPDLNRIRYFMAISPLIYVLLAFWFDRFYRFFEKKKADAFTAFVFLIILLSNGWGIAYFYGSLASGAQAKDMMRSPKMSYYDDFVTLGDLTGGLDFMVSDSGKSGKDICFHPYDYQYKSVYNLLGRMYYPKKVIDHFSPGDLIKNCNFYIVVRTEKGEGDIDNEYRNRFEIVDKKRFDFLTVFKLDYKPAFAGLANSEGKMAEKDRPDENGDDDPRITVWSEIFK